MIFSNISAIVFSNKEGFFPNEHFSNWYVSLPNCWKYKTLKIVLIKNLRKNLVFVRSFTTIPQLPFFKKIFNRNTGDLFKPYKTHNQKRFPYGFYERFAIVLIK